ACEVCGQLPVQRADDVVRPEREPRGGRDGFLPPAVVERARDPSLAVERERALLEEPLKDDEPVEGDARRRVDGGEVEAGVSRQEGARARRRSTRPRAGRRPRARARTAPACPG